MTVRERSTPPPDLSAAHERYVRQFEAVDGNGAGRAPDWLRERRRAAIARFAERGFPTSREEAWRFTDVKPIARGAFALADRSTVSPAARETLEPLLLGGPDRIAAVFVNGRFAPELSQLDRLPDGVRLGSLDEALRAEPELIRRHLAQHARDDTTPFTALNTAFMADGGFAHVARDVVLDRPLQLVFLTAAAGDGALVCHPRTLVVVERGAQAALVETYAGAGESVSWTNAVTEIVVAENANLDAYRVQRESPAAYHTAATHSHQGRNSVHSLITFSFGAALSRQDLHAVLGGEGAETTLDGLSVLGGRQHVDYHTTLEHARPHCNSWEFFNGIFDARARGVFNGRIIVRPGAQKTDAKQTNNNLLLSRQARADSQPQLEIYADDVRCTHGATLGPLDQAHVFYLRSRGLAPDEARALLTFGFASEILANVTIDELRERLDALVRDRLAAETRAPRD